MKRLFMRLKERFKILLLYIELITCDNTLWPAAGENSNKVITSQVTLPF